VGLLRAMRIRRASIALRRGPISADPSGGNAGWRHVLHDHILPSVHRVREAEKVLRAREAEAAANSGDEAAHLRVY
jgi:hypothetical protein